MDGAVAWILMASAVAVFLVGVESKARVCYFGPPPEPDPENPDGWMKQVMQEVRARCPGQGRRQPTTAGTAACSSPEPLGMEDRTIPDDRIKASSSLLCCPANNSRLNGDTAWVALDSEALNSWIGVNLVKRTVVSGITTQGHHYGDHTTKYKVAYKERPSSAYEYVTDGNGDIKVFIGNTDGSSPVTNMFNENVVATVVRIEPTAIYVHAALRFELLGCRLG
ncbi:lactadherin-like [Patiria miniata]|uniref:F5/8 type C domain-containing protein n=1 Tax=Patiria miniata TaxID=46514 RepID=A0A914ADY8_PATMI|nr:lactadherin-like [Patiria miniata]